MPDSYQLLRLLIDSMSPEPAGIPEMKLFLKVHFSYSRWLTVSDEELVQLGGGVGAGRGRDGDGKALRTANQSARSNVLS